MSDAEVSQLSKPRVSDFGTTQYSRFQNLELGKASTDDKCILHSLGLDLVNINVSAKFYQNIPNGLRVMGTFRKLSCDKIFANCPGSKSSQTVRGWTGVIIGHTLDLKVKLQLLCRSTFFGSCNSE